MRFLDLIKPITSYLPEIAPPDRKLPTQERIMWTLLALFIFLVCCQMPLFGINHSGSVDPLYWARVILASNKGSLMELGTAPILTSSMVMQILAGAKIIDVDHSLMEDRVLFGTAQKLLGILITFGEATAYLIVGVYGPLGDLGFTRAILIVAQLVCSGFLVMMLDELLQKGYGLGSGLSLFIACNICENIIWKALSPTTINSGKGTEFEGALVSFFHLLFKRENKFEALREAFYRSNAPNMMNLLATIFIFAVVIYFQGFKYELRLGNQRVRGNQSVFPIKLFYTSNIPIIMQTALVSNLYFFSQILYRKFRNNTFVNLLGRWQDLDVGGTSVAVGGLAYYLTPPRNMGDIISDPLHCVIYVSFVLFSCALFARAWLDISGGSPKDITKQLRDQNMFIVGRKHDSIYSTLKTLIPTAAALGGICIGMLTVVADFLGAVGSGTGILLGVSILYSQYEMLMKNDQDGQVLG